MVILSESRFSGASRRTCICFFCPHPPQNLRAPSPGPPQTGPRLWGGSKLRLGGIARTHIKQCHPECCFWIAILSEYFFDGHPERVPLQRAESKDLHLLFLPSPTTKPACPIPGALTDRSSSVGWIQASLGSDSTNQRRSLFCTAGVSPAVVRASSPAHGPAFAIPGPYPQFGCQAPTHPKITLTL